MSDVTWYKGRRKPKKPGTYWVIMRAKHDFAVETGIHEDDVWFEEAEFGTYGDETWDYSDDSWEILAWCEPIVPPIEFNYGSGSQSGISEFVDMVHEETSRLDSLWSDVTTLKEIATHLSRPEDMSNGDFADIYASVMELSGYQGIKAGDEFVIWESSRVKSAAPVEVNEKEFVIDVENRFNTNVNDIRYSMRDYENPAIYIQDSKVKGQAVNYTDDIFSGKKTIETRTNRLLDNFRGREVAVIKNVKGKRMLVGYITLADQDPEVYDTVKKFRDAEGEHRVYEGDKYDIVNAPNGVKYGYHIESYREIDPVELKSDEIVSGNRTAKDLNVRYSNRGVAPDGRTMYESNFPKGTPVSAKTERILSYIQNVWSKNPIELKVQNGINSRTILAKFDPTIIPGEYTDATKIAGGNRHGNHTEQRVTLDLGDDYHEIASNATYNYSKMETGKTTGPHKDVIMWHYFVNEIYFTEYGDEKYEPYTVTINVKEKADGDYVYSFSAEKEFANRQTLHADGRAVYGPNGELFYEENTIDGSKSQGFKEQNSDRDNLQADINNEEKILDILDSLRTKGISSAQNKAIAQLINLASSTDQIADELRDVARLSGNTELERLHAIERMIKRENFLKSQIAAAEEMVQKEKANTEKVKAADAETIEKRDERIKKLKQDLADLRKQKNERIDEIRADRDRKLRELLERKNQQIQDNQTGRRRTAIIHKIQRLESKLTNDIKNRTDKGAFYPTTLITACIDALRLLDTSGESKFEYEDVDGYKVPHEANKAKLKYQSIKEALNDLKTEYDALKGSTDYDYASEYESEMSELIGELAKAIGNKPVREMSIQQVEDVYSVLKDIDTVISNAKHQLGTQDRITNYELAEGIVSEMRAQRGNANWYAEMKTKLSNEVLSPIRLINRITGYNPDSILMDLTNKLNDGLKVANAFKMDAVTMFDELRTGENEKRFADACNNEEEWNVSLTSETGLPTGEKLRMTHMQALQVVMSWDREHLGKTSGTKHMEEGGLIIPDQNLLKKGKVRDAVINGQRVSFLKDEDIFAIREQLTEYDKRFMSAAEQYFNVLAKDEINKTMLTLKGRIKATEDHYIPFKVDDGTIDAKMDALTYDASIMSYGMLKSITTGASNALIMEGLNQVLGKHIDSAAKIVGIAIPVRNFQKVYNTRMRGGNSTVHDAIGRTWGAGTEDAIEQMVADIQANRKHERSTLGDVLDFSQNVFVQSTLAGNISVTIKQAASYSTAGLYLSQRALFPFQATVMRLFANNKSEFAQNLFDEIDRYTPEHWSRRQGLSTQEIGDRAIKDGTLSSTVNKIPDALNPMRWIQNMDVATTAALWLACKEQVAIDGTKPSAGDEYWTKVTKLYEKVIEETQPMYDSLHRAEVQKSTNALQRQVVMFQTQPLQNSGIIYDAYGNLKAAVQSNDESLKKSAKQKFGRAVLSQVSSSIVFATMTFLAYLIKGKSKRYRDKDDEISAWSILERMGLDVTQTWTSLFAPAVGSYLFDFVDRLVNGNKWYDLVSVPAVDTINDFAESIINFGNAFTGDKIDWNKAGAQAWNISEQVAHMFGIPAENIYNLISGTVNNAKAIVTGKEGFFSNDIQRDDSEQVNRMWSGITSGNGELYKEAFNQLVASLKETKGYGRDEAIAEAQNKLARRVTDQQKKGNISEREAARYYEKYCGMERDEAELKAAVNSFKYFNKDYASWLNDGGNDLSNEQIIKLIESEANPKEVFRIMKREGMTFSKALAEATK